MRLDDGSADGSAGQFHTRRWTLVLVSAQNQGQGPLRRLWPNYVRFMAQLAGEYRSKHKESLFEALKDFVGIGNDNVGGSYDEAAKALNVGVGTVKTLIHRLRKRYIEIVRQEVARTVSDPAEINSEIHPLCDALIAAEGRTER